MEGHPPGPIASSAPVKLQPGPTCQAGVPASTRTRKIRGAGAGEGEFQGMGQLPWESPPPASTMSPRYSSPAPMRSPSFASYCSPHLCRSLLSDLQKGDEISIGSPLPPKIRKVSPGPEPDFRARVGLVPRRVVSPIRSSLVFKGSVRNPPPSKLPRPLRARSYVRKRRIRTSLQWGHGD